MEGYRASLIICLPEFDTYHILADYARYPESKKARLGFRALVQRAVMTIRWRVHNSDLCHKDNVKDVVKAYLGTEDLGKAEDPKDKKIPDMNAQELMDFYNKAIASVGLTVDPEALAKAKQE